MPKILTTTAGINHLLDVVIERGALKNDAALCRALDIAPPVASKLRHGRLPLGATIIIAIHEFLDMPVSEIRALALGGPA